MTTAPGPKDIAIRNAADAVQAHKDDPDTYTLHRMTQAVQTAQNLGASLHDIRRATTN